MSIPPEFQFADSIATRLGLAGLFLTAFSFSASTAGASLGLTMLLIGFLLVLPKHWRWIVQDRIVQLSLLLCLYIAILAAWSAWQRPEAAAQQWHSARELAMLSFPIVGVWIGQNERRAHLALLLAMLGFVIELFYHAIPDWEDFARAIHEDPIMFRYTFHKTAATLGLFTATTLLGLLLFAPALVGSARQRLMVTLRLLLWLLAVGMVGYALLLSFSRASWLAFLLIGIPALFFAYRRHLSSRFAAQHRWLALASVAAVMLLSAVFVADKVGNRLAFETESYSKLLAGDVDTLDDLSVGSRARMMVYGYDLWRQHPLVGWGPATTELMLDNHPRSALHQFTHLHNSYLELAVRIGAVGLILLLLIVALASLRLWRRYRESVISSQTAWFLLGSLGILAVWSAFDVRLDHTDWRQYWLLLGGIVYGLGLPPRRNDGSAC